jgi:hypothetical protein
VLLVDQAEDHVAAVNTGGLTVERRDGADTVPVRAITPDTLGPGLDLVLLAVKSQDTPAALQVLVPRMESMAVAEAAGIRLEPFDEYDPAVYLSRPHQDQDRDLARPRRAPA